MSDMQQQSGSLASLAQERAQSQRPTEVPPVAPPPEPGVLRWPGFEMHGDQGPMFKAIAAARAQFSEIKKTRLNPFFNSKYADLSDVLDATMPAYSACGLTLNQLPTRPSADGGWTVYTILGHESGAFWLLQATVPAAEWQKFGSALTYCRRYVDSAVLGVASEPDDDGNEADAKGSGPRANTQPTPPSGPKARPAQDKPEPEKAPKPAQAPETKPQPAESAPKTKSEPPPKRESLPEPPPDLAGALAEEEANAADLSPNLAAPTDEQNNRVAELFKSKVWPRLDNDSGSVVPTAFTVTGEDGSAKADLPTRRAWLKEKLGISDPKNQLTTMSAMAKVIEALEKLPNRAP